MKVFLTLEYCIHFRFICSTIRFATQIFGSRVRVSGASQIAEIELAEKQKMKEKCDKIIGHGINCFINRYAQAHSIHDNTN